MPDGPPRRSMDGWAIILMVICCAFWGGNAVAVKFATPQVPPFGVAMFRFLLSLPILAMICRFTGQPLWVPPRYWKLLLGHGLITVMQIGSFNWGTSQSAAGRSSIFINVHPLIVAPLAWAILGERIGWRSVLGLVTAAVGVTIILSASVGSTRTSLVGDYVVLASGVVFAVQTILQKKTFPYIPPATLLFNQTLVAIPIFLLYSAWFEGLSTYRITPTVFAALAYQGVAVSGFCFSVWLLLLGRYPAAQLSTIAFVTPLFGVMLGRLLKNEPLTLPLVGGGILVGFGIYMTSSDRAAHLRPAEDVALPGEDAP